MKLKNVLIVVKNMEHAKTFYKELLGLDVILDRRASPSGCFCVEGVH